MKRYSVSLMFCDLWTWQTELEGGGTLAQDRCRVDNPGFRLSPEFETSR
jgi:hypothetical protein